MDNSKGKTTYYDKQPQLLKTKPSKIKEHMQKGMTVFMVIASSLIFFFVLLRFSNISSLIAKIVNVAMPIIYGFVIAFLLNPVMKLLEKAVYRVLNKWTTNEKLVTKFSRIIGVFGAFLFGILVIVALLNLVIPELYTSISGLVVSLPKDIENWIRQLNAMGEGDTTVQKLLQEVLLQGSQMLENWVKTDLLARTDVLSGKVTAGVISVVNGLVDFLVRVMTSIYILFSKDNFMVLVLKMV